MRRTSYRFHSFAALLVGAFVSLSNHAGDVPVLTEFRDGTAAKAAEVNGNFTVIRDVVNTNNTRLGTVEAASTAQGASIGVLNTTTANHETRITSVENSNSPGNTMPDKQFRAGSIADIARGHSASVTAGTTITDFGPTGDYSALSSWQTNIFPAAMTLDFGGVAYGIFEITFQSFWPTDIRYIPSYSGVGSYRLEYSTDNTTWTNVPAVAPVQGDIFVHRLAATGISARYFRLVVNAPNTPANPVNISRFQVLSFIYGDSAAVDARRVYGNGPEVLSDSANTTRMELHSGNTGSHIFGSNNAGNLHIDSDKTKSDGRMYLNWYNGKGVVFGNGAGTAGVGSVDTSGNVNFNGNYSQGGMVFKGIAAGGTCLGGIIGLWDPQTTSFGGATCTGQAVYDAAPPRTLTCPPNTTKLILFAMTNSNRGGEGGICLR